GLDSGSYKLEFYDYDDLHLPEWYDDKPDKDSADPVAVTAGMTTTVNVQLTPGGVISGVVTAEDSGLPLSDVDVNLYEASTGNFIKDETTNASGVYRLGSLTTGSYKLSFRDGNEVYILEYYDDKPDKDSADPITVTAGMTTTINAQLSLGGAIDGTVTAEDGGAPLNNIGVEVYDVSTGDYAGYGNTNASGAYRIGSLASGNYRVVFYDPADVYLTEYYDDKFNSNDADPVPVTAGMTTTINAQLARAGVISGVVTAEGSGLPLSDIDVDVYVASSGNWLKDEMTDASGVYRISGLASGDYKLRFLDTNQIYLTEYYDDKPTKDSADLVTVAVGMTTTANAQLVLGGVVNGVVTAEGSGAALDNIDVNVHDASSGDYVADGETDASGAYRISRIPTGSYKLYIRDLNGVYLAEWYDDKPDSDGADTFTVTAGMTTTINAQLAPGGVISGVVTAEDSGLPLSNVDVDVYEASSGNRLGDVTTDELGGYRFGSLATGDYKLRFRDINEVYVTEYYDNKPDRDSADPIAVTAGFTTTVNAQLTPGGVVAGTVVAEGSGAPLSDIDVNVYDVSNGDYVSDDTTDDSGAYRVGGLDAGNYKVEFHDLNGIYQPEYYDDKPDFDSGDAVAVAVGVTTTVNAQLTVGGVISGMVTDEDSGVPLEDITVRIYEASTGDYVDRETTDASGAYRFGGLRTNLYKLYCEDYGGQYLLEWYHDKPDGATADLIAVSAGVTTTVNMALARGGSVTGRVTDADFGAGITDVRVETYRYDASTSNRSSYTNANGYYTITALYTGVYRVSFYPPRPYYGQRYDGFRLGSGLDLITVSAPLTTTGINAALDKGYFISGTVTSGSAPVSGVSVRVYRGDSTSYSSSYNTGSDGVYWLGALDPNQYRVQFKPSDLYAIQWYSDSASYDGSTVINLSGDLGNINADLSAGGSITGRVTGAGGAPLADLRVYIYPAGHSNSLISVRTDDDGYYATAPVLPTGHYQVEFSAPLGYTEEWYDDKPSQESATTVLVVAGQTTRNVNAQLAAYAHGAITGTVTAADTGLPLSTWVYAYSVSGLGTWSKYASGGSFTIKGLPPDTYRVKYNSPHYPYIFGYYHDKADWDSADLVTVTAGMTTSLAVQALQVGGGISGTVTGPGGGMPGVYVYVQRMMGSSLTSSSYTGVDGSYYLWGLDAGEYRVQFTPPSPFMREWYDNALDTSAARYVTVTLGATTANVDAVMEAGGVITGLITAADTGNPLPGAYTNVYSTSGSLVRDYAYARADGQYQTPGLPAGTYQVYFSPGSWNRYIAEWYDDALPSSVHMTVTVPVSGVTPNINAALDQGGSISGWTYNALKGQPMRSVRARVFDAHTGGAYIAYDNSNNGGLYQVNGLPSGQYKVSFSEGGFETRWYSQTWDWDSAFTVTVSAPDDTPNINAYLDYMYDVYLPVMLHLAP
ncbi:MAG: carboxypeptidase regulatory-like domain-containing protein, partial [Anaerolineae bacterium]